MIQANASAIRRAIDHDAERFGRIDGIVNNAVLHSERMNCAAIPKADWELAPGFLDSIRPTGVVLALVSTGGV